MGEIQELDLRHYVGVLLRHWWLVILAPLVAGLVTLLYTKSQPPVYQATTKVMVQQTASSPVPTLADLQASQALASTYAEIVRSRPVLTAALDRLDLDLSVGNLTGLVSATVIRNTQILEINAEYTQPDVAALLANTVAEAFIEQTQERRLAEIARLQGVAVAQGLANADELVSAQLSAVGSLSIVEPAIAPGGPVRPTVFRTTLLFVLLGGVVGVLGAFLLEHFRNKVDSPNLVEQSFGLTTLGTVARWKPREVGPYELVMRVRPRSHFAEAFRHLRANLQFVTGPQGARVLIVTSPSPGDGKTTVLSNLGVALAQEGKRVVVVDADLRRPSLHRVFKARGTVGLSNYLADPSTEVEGVIYPTETPGLRVVPSGPRPPNPAELLGSPRLREFLDQLAQEADVVLVDTPPLLAVADASIMAAQTQGTILVADAHGTRIDSFDAALDNLRKASARVLGVVLEKVRPRRLGYGYSYSYYYYYSSYGADGQAASRANGAAPWLREPQRWLRRVTRTFSGSRR